MAGVGGLRSFFNARQVTGILEEFQKDIDDKILQTLQYLGEEFVNKARENDTYKDRTGNLRSSIGYIILYNGEVVDKSFELSEKGTDRHTGLKKAKSFADEVALEHPKGFVLIGVAGMAYAAAVEAKSYDVITGSAPNSNDIKSILNEIKP